MAPEVSIYLGGLNFFLCVVMTWFAFCNCNSQPSFSMLIQVIKNSNCNLMVDIWSLGCTVLEMATAKPPWSNFEGVSNFDMDIGSFDLFLIYQSIKGPLSWALHVHLMFTI